MVKEMDTLEHRDSKWRFILRTTKFHRVKHESSTDSPTTQDLEKWSGVGPHADEQRMPRWLIRVLESGDRISTVESVDPDGIKTIGRLRAIETPYLIPVLARLSTATSNIQHASFCNPATHYVAKLRREGSFCGYRNIQMMLSYLYNVEALAIQQLEGQSLPTIFTLQQMIEKAWDEGFNTSSRDDIGRLYMTRKFIGTSEAEAIFLKLSVPVSTRSFVSSPECEAYQSLLKHVHNYFGLDKLHPPENRVVMTKKPPIFLQRPGHSMTIVGIDEDDEGAHSLVVFNPNHQPKKAIKRLVTNDATPPKPEKLLNAYRYGAPELSMYSAFEILQLDDPFPESAQAAVWIR